MSTLQPNTIIARVLYWLNVRPGFALALLFALLIAVAL